MTSKISIEETNIDEKIQEESNASKAKRRLFKRDAKHRYLIIFCIVIL